MEENLRHHRLVLVIEEMAVKDGHTLAMAVCRVSDSVWFFADSSKGFESTPDAPRRLERAENRGRCNCNGSGDGSRNGCREHTYTY